MHRACLVVCLCLLAVPAASQTKSKTKKPVGPGPTGQRPRFKAIFEPANYSEDIQLEDIYFVDENEGWAAGQRNGNSPHGGVLIHTQDAGKTWEVVAGDPNSDTSGFRQVKCKDAHTCWATQYGDQLLGTTDGKTWETIADNFSAYNEFGFFDAHRGIYIHTGKIFLTADGGRHWKQVYECAVHIEVDGLPRNQSCEFETINLATDSVGYALTRKFENGDSGVFKTTDGGQSWKLAGTIAQADGKQGALFFMDENTGAARANYSSFFLTNDGGATWKHVIGQAPGGDPKIMFGDRNGGWSVHANEMAYTTNGGREWKSQQIAFPTRVAAFSLPSARHGYVAGEHGMIYRYRVVPVEYSAPRMLPAPMMPGSEPAK